MKAIIPAAGVGTRLRPITNTTPKALVQVGDRPIIGHILDRIVALGIEDIVIVIGHLGELIREYVGANHPQLNVDYIYQRERLGLGHAIWLCGESIPEERELIIIYGDTIVEGNLADVFKTEGDGALGVRRVHDPERFGIVEVQDNRIVRMVEKPETFIGDLALIGFNFIRKSTELFDALNKIVENDIRTHGEIQLTDAFQAMVDKGADFRPFVVDGWFDCGKPAELIATNRHIIEQLHTEPKGEDCVFIPPVYIAPDAEVKDSIIGPNVTISSRAQIERCILSDTVVNPGAVMRGCYLSHSLIGIEAVINQPARNLMLGDYASIEGAL
jgi:glucose-1-phosphate thymidylyltransferase